MVKAIKWWGKKDRSYPLVCFSQKYQKIVHMINNDGEHTMNIEDAVSS